MNYEDIITLTIFEGEDRESLHNSDGTKRGENEPPRVIKYTKRIINLPQKCTLERGKYRLLLTPVDSPDLQWKQGFLELYLFFKEILTMVTVIVTTQAGRELWNKTLRERDLKLISTLGGQLQ